MKNEEKSQEVKIIDGQIQITIGINTLAQIAPFLGYLQTCEDDGYTIVDPYVFAKSVIEQLGVENEDGTTLVHGMFDLAITHVCENGEPGIDFKD